jgi:hypothetical protein
MEEGLNWDEELERRIEFLKCRTCGGTNPYVCACAKNEFLKRKDDRNVIGVPRYENLWTKPHGPTWCLECNTIIGSPKCQCSKKLRKLI